MNILTSECRLMKHLTRTPPIEWDIIRTFLPPEAVYADSSFFEKVFIVSWSLKESNYIKDYQFLSEKGK